MTYTFDRHGRLVVIPVFVAGPAGGRTFRFAVDTAATRTGMSGLILERLGYREADTTAPRQVRTGSGGTRAGLIRVARLSAFDQVRVDHPVLWQRLPPTVQIEGLLGLDFFRGRVLTLDFLRGKIALDPPRPWWRFWR